MPTDPYASRHEDHWKPVPRLDPVIHGAAPGPLAPDQLAAFEGDGYLFVPDLFRPEEAAAWLERVEDLAARRVADGSDEVIREPDSDVVRSVFRVHRQPAFEALIADPRLVGVARQVLGGRCTCTSLG